MLFTKAFLRDRCGCDYVSQILTGHDRWSLHYDEVFEHEGKLYETSYSRGATEMQDERPYEYAPDMIECPEVEAVERTVIRYQKKV